MTFSTPTTAPTSACTVAPVVAYTNAISQQAKATDGSARNALALLGRMRQEGVAPTAVTLNAVIDAQAKCRDGSAKVALSLLDAMKNSTARNVRPTVVTYTSAIDCQAKCSDGDARTALSLLEEMCSQGLVPNNITFGCAINAQSRKGSANMATSLLRKMVQRGLAPSASLYTAVIEAQLNCGDGSAVDAKNMLDYMRTTSTPTLASYSSCIEAQAKCENGTAAAAASCLVGLLEQGLVPDAAIFAGVIDAQAKKRDGSARTAAMVLQRMHGVCEANQVHFNSAINACANERPAAVELAEPILEAMLARGMQPNQYTLSAMFRCAGFSKPQRPDLARTWFNQYCRSGAVDINDHVARALRTALGDAADELLVSVGASRHVRSSSSPRGSWRGGSSSPSGTPSSSGRPSATLFTTPRRSSVRSDSWRSRTPSPTFEHQPTAFQSSLSLSLSPTASPSLRRTSLVDKIAALKAQREMFPAATAPARKSSTALLAPGFFSSGTPAPRAPCGPDGTRGFTNRRSVVLVC